jgi:hypothetical protein
MQRETEICLFEILWVSGYSSIIQYIIQKPKGKKQKKFHQQIDK